VKKCLCRGSEKGLTRGRSVGRSVTQPKSSVARARVYPIPYTPVSS